MDANVSACLIVLAICYFYLRRAAREGGEYLALKCNAETSRVGREIYLV